MLHFSLVHFSDMLSGCKKPEISRHDLKPLSDHVVGYHLCQMDNATTCKVPNFVHSLAAQMSQNPLLKPYNHILSISPFLRSKLSLQNCVADSDSAFVQGILEPLKSLRKEGRLGETYIIIIDALCDSHYHRPDYGDSIITFLGKHLKLFPPWLKIICTVRTDKSDLIADFKLEHIR